MRMCVSCQQSGASVEQARSLRGPRAGSPGRLVGMVAAASFALNLGLAHAQAQELPQGGHVAAGAASIGAPHNGTLDINQSSDRAVIDWHSFSIGQGGTVNFHQPGASSATLNRVTGDTPSSIAGAINAPGTVLLVNPNGIAITKSGVINTGSFAASTLDIKNKDFMSGNYTFRGNGASTAVKNAGRIDASDGGFAALLGGHVANDGVIRARLGKVALGSGELITLDLAGDGFLSVGVPTKDLKKLKGTNGKPLVSNKGKIIADGGVVELKAATAAGILRDAVNVPGSIQANSVGVHNGKIVLGGGAGGRVHVAGRIKARGSKHSDGGKVSVTGKDIDLPGMIDASAGGKGRHGGTVYVVANDNLDFGGLILAEGGDGGTGGNVETSGHTLRLAGAKVDTSALNGKSGSWLLDPYDIAIDSAAGTAISNSLSNSNVIVQTTASGHSGFGTATIGNGDIIIASNITWSSSNTLTLSAFHDISNLPGTSIRNSGGGNLILRADNSGTGSGTVQLTNSIPGPVTFTALAFGGGDASPPPLPLPAAIDFHQSTGKVTIYYDPKFGYAVPTNYDTAVAKNSAVASQLTAYMLVNNINDLQNINQNLSGSYALSRDIDASATASWNGGFGFMPIGYSSISTTNYAVPTYHSLSGINATPTQFIGTFDGAGHTISNLVINNTTAFNLGLFSLIGHAGIVRNVRLIGGRLTAGSHQNFGLLAGWNYGTISNAYVTGIATSGDYASNTGGLVGWNWGGTISDSYASGNVTSGNNASGTGGLVGFNGYYYSNHSSILDSHAAGTVTSGSNSTTIGGLVGDHDSAVIRDSYATGNVVGGAGASSIGGLAGQNNGYWGGDLVTTSYATGNVSGASGSRYIGGLIGVNLWTSTLNNSYARGDVSGTNDVGGLVGWNGYTTLTTHVISTIDTSYATGHVTGTNYVGGLVGYENSSTVTNSYWDNQTTGQSRGLGGASGGSFSANPLTTRDLKLHLPAGFDGSVWALNGDINAGYPFLIGNIPPALTVPLTPPPAPTHTSMPTNTSLLYIAQRHSISDPTNPPAENSLAPTIQFQQQPTAQHVSLSATQSGQQQRSGTNSGDITGSIPKTDASTSLVVTPDGNTDITNTSEWTGTNAPISAYNLIKAVQPFVAFSKKAYNPEPGNDWSQYASQMGLSPIEVTAFKALGFQAGVYKRDGRIIVAFAGSTTSLKDIPGTLVDWLGNNIPNALHTLPSSGALLQYAAAEKLAKAVMTANPGVDVTVTGHSLGGGLAAYTGATLGIPAVTFNPEGISFAANEPHNDSNVINFEVATDRAGTGGSLIGTTIVFDKSLMSTLGMSTNPITGPASNAVKDYLGLGVQHDLNNFIDVAYSSFSPNLTFTGSVPADTTGTISHTGPTYFVSVK